MAVLHNKEHKIATVIESLPKKYSDDQFVEQFIKLYSKEWGKIKSAYIKQSQDKEPGAVINMPKPDLYLKQLLKNFLQQEQPTKTAEGESPKIEKPLAKTIEEAGHELKTDEDASLKTPKKEKEAVEKPKKVTAVKVAKEKKQ